MIQHLTEEKVITNFMVYFSNVAHRNKRLALQAIQLKVACGQSSGEREREASSSSRPVSKLIWVQLSALINLTGTALPLTDSKTCSTTIQHSYTLLSPLLSPQAPAFTTLSIISFIFIHSHLNSVRQCPNLSLPFTFSISFFVCCLFHSLLPIPPFHIYIKGSSVSLQRLLGIKIQASISTGLEKGKPVNNRASSLMQKATTGRQMTRLLSSHDINNNKMWMEIFLLISIQRSTGKDLQTLVKGI